MDKLQAPAIHKPAAFNANTILNGKSTSLEANWVNVMDCTGTRGKLKHSWAAVERLIQGKWGDLVDNRSCEKNE